MSSVTSTSSWQVPKWLQITKIAEGHYRVTDTSVDAIGLYLGSFPTQTAAQRFAVKVSEARSEARMRNLRRMQGQMSGELIERQSARSRSHSGIATSPQ